LASKYRHRPHVETNPHASTQGCNTLRLNKMKAASFLFTYRQKIKHFIQDGASFRRKMSPECVHLLKARGCGVRWFQSTTGEYTVTE